MTGRTPELYETIAAEPGLGEAVALRFCNEFGGQQIYMPAPENIGAGHKLAQSLDLAAARALARLVGSGHIVVPMGPNVSAARQARAIRRALEEGLSSNAIAKRLNIHRRTVEYHRAALREEKQGDLFGKRAAS